jgi:hypothetical protein
MADTKEPTQEKPLISISSLDNLPTELKAKIQVWYLQKMPWRKMSTELKADGYSVHHVKLYHWCKNNLRGFVSKELPLDITDDDRLAIEKQTITALFDIALEAVRGIDTPKVFNVDDLSKLSGAVARLVAAQVQRDRLQHDQTTAIEKIRAQFMAEVQQQLSGEPELVERLHAVIAHTSVAPAAKGQTLN